MTLLLGAFHDKMIRTNELVSSLNLPFLVLSISLDREVTQHPAVCKGGSKWTSYRTDRSNGYLVFSLAEEDDGFKSNIVLSNILQALTVATGLSVRCGRPIRVNSHHSKTARSESASPTLLSPIS